MKKNQIELNNLLNVVKEAGGTIKELASEIESVSRGIINIEQELNNIDIEIDVIRGRTITPEELIKSFEKIVPYLEKVNKDELRDILNLIIKDIRIKKPIFPEEKWAITEIGRASCRERV